MSYSLEELKALAAAMQAIPQTDEEVTTFMSEVDAGNYDEAVARSMKLEPPEEVVAKLKAELQRLKLEAMEREGITPEDLYIPYSEKP